MNHFLNTIGAVDTDTWSCGAIQSLKHVIDSCTIFSLPNGVQGLKDLDDETIKWLYSSDFSI